MANVSLADYQAQFYANLLSEEVGDEGLSFLALMEIQFGKASADKESRLRLDIYRNNVLHSLRSALGDLYPVVKRLIGDNCFNLIAVEFIREKPPSDPALLFYGEEFIDYLSQHQSVAHLNYLPDVARLEFAHHIAFHSADVMPLDIGELAGVAPESLGELVFEAHPSVSLLKSPWPVDAIWHENIKEQPSVLDLGTLGAANVLVYRLNFDIQIVSLDENCFNFLSQLLNGQTINQAWHHAMANGKGLENSELSPMLGYLLNLGVFSACEVKL